MSVNNRGILKSERAERSNASLRADRAEFLSEASQALNSSLDFEDTLSRIARLAVPKMADWCVIDIVVATDTLERLVVAHTDPGKEAKGSRLARRYPPNEEAVAGSMRVLRTGEAELVADIPDSLLASFAQNEEHLALLRDLGLGSYICVPLQARGHTLAVLTCITAESERHYTADDLDLFRALAGHAGQAIENARLFADLECEVAGRQQREARLASLSQLYAVQAQMTEAVVNAHDRAGLFADICRIAVETGGFRLAWVGMIEPETEYMRPVAHQGIEAQAYLATVEPALYLGNLLPGPSIRAVQENRLIISNDIGSEQQGQPWRNPALDYGYRSSAALPLRLRGNVVGTFNVYANEEGFFYAEKARLFAEITKSISFALDSLDQEWRRREAENTLQQERTFLATAMHNLRDGLVACNAQGDITQFNSAAQEFHGRSVEGMGSKNWGALFELFQPDGVTPLEKAQIPLYRALAGETLHEVEMVIVPERGERRVVVCNGQALYDASAQKVGAVVTMHDITARKQAEAHLLKLAFYDSLTGLANRRLLMDRLNHALELDKRQPGCIAVLFIDLDRLKIINDSLGHETGDQLLILIAQRLKEVMRATDTLARIGGDEFVVVCEDLSDEEEAITLSRRIAATIAEPCWLESAETEVVVSASIGIAIARQGETADDLLHNADTAMYQAKHRGKARHVLFDDALRTQAVERLHAENALRKAIADGQLRLLYQPIFDLKDARIVGAEALVRYQDPERGLVMPGEFLDIAEESGLILPIGKWVLEEACREARHWREIAPDFEIAVNLSTRQLGDSTFTEVLNDVLMHNRLPPRAVALEITESVLMEAAVSKKRVLAQLKDAGSHLGIDDFGTGYSSLTYLRRFPVDFVKIDHSFVQGIGKDEDDTAIVKAVINLGQALRLTTIAEGVETAAQADLLRQLGCDRVQGFYFGRPQSADALTTCLRNA